MVYKVGLPSYFLFVNKKIIIAYAFLLNILYSAENFQGPSSFLQDILQEALNSDHHDAIVKLIDDYSARAYCPDALYMKGVLLLNPHDNGQRNANEATCYFAKAAAMGHVKAMAALADSFLNGDGAEKDAPAAAHWYKTAADLGDGYGQFNIGILYYRGIGVTQDFKKAYDYFNRAAQNKNFETMRDVAIGFRDQAAQSVTDKDR